MGSPNIKQVTPPAPPPEPPPAPEEGAKKIRRAKKVRDRQRQGATEGTNQLRVNIQGLGFDVQ